MSQGDPKLLQQSLDAGFPVLRSVLATYFRPDRMRDAEFLQRWYARGEDSIEFTGLPTDILAAVRHPQDGADVMNEALRLTPPVDADTARDWLITLSDTMNGAQDDQAQDDVEDSPWSDAATARHQEQFAAWISHPVLVPGSTSSVPLWLLGLASLVVGLLGAVIASTGLPVITAIGRILVWVSFACLAVWALYAMLLRSAVRGDADKPVRPERAGKAPGQTRTGWSRFLKI